MILIIGGSGFLGSKIVQLLLEKKLPVRVMTRNPEKLAKLKTLGVEVVTGDLCEPQTITTACQGVTQVVYAAHGFLGERRNNPEQVDGKGAHQLIDAAKAAGVQQFIYTSIYDSRSDHPLDVFRIKFATENYLRNSGLTHTILCPTAFMESWADAIGKMVMKFGVAIVPGSGDASQNYISANDVARFAVWALTDPRSHNRTFSLGGAENLNMNELVEIYAKVAGKPARCIHFPLFLVHIAGWLAWPFVPKLSRRMVTAFTTDVDSPDIDKCSAFLKFCPMQRLSLTDYVCSRYPNKQTKS